MRCAHVFLLLALFAGMATAQSQSARQTPPVPDGAAEAAGAGQPRDRASQRIERIRVQDGGSTVEELRYGGQTQRISVQPRADVPAYEILPEGGTRSGPAGQRVWNVLNF